MGLQILNTGQGSIYIEHLRKIQIEEYEILSIIVTSFTVS